MSEQWVAHRNQLLAAIMTIVGIGILALTGYSLAYAGKIYGGVTVDGVAVGGLNVSDAQKKIAAAASNYNNSLLPVQYGDTTVRIPVSQLAVKYDSNIAEDAVQYGRGGGLWQQTHARLRALFGRSTAFTGYKYDETKLKPFLDQIDDDAAAPVANAALSFTSGSVAVSDAQPGKRLDRGSLVIAIKHQLESMGSDVIEAPIYDMPAAIDSGSLAAAKTQADRFISEPVTLKVNSQTKSVDVATITSWIKVDEAQAQTDIGIWNPAGFYRAGTPVDVKLTMDRPKVQAFVADLAKSVDQQGQNAALTIQDDKATVFKPSRNGIALDQNAATDAIIEVVNHSAGNRTATLAVKITKPEVNEEDLNNLGIKELIGEGVSYFPGSSAARITNVRVGQSRYNGVLIKPGDTFSFGAQLGDVGPEQGYQPSLVIIGNKEEKQYGGGLCQVSSTLYRAALNAGLPIVQRTNHAFAINEFYTQPYPAPGVDATIYYPEVDLKFKNDTGSWILIQTEMVGTTLKFDLYGTKTKSGVIRGPYFVSGSMDATQPSHTVFYRDVVDLNGSVIKTDTVNTYYKSSKDFTVVDTKQFN